ncbi:MAG: cupin domain-containing protein [Burkholderiaceae bacterium]|nr:cupin domain-containing protein [Burkholderiaceae bacterium]
MNESLVNAERNRRAPGSHCDRVLRLCALPLALAAPIAVQAVHPGDSHPAVVSADAVKWGPAPPSLPPGAQAVALYGSPSKEGPFVLRLKFPAGFTVPPHRHSKDEFVTVISGRFALSVGEQIDAASLKALPPGSFIHLPAGTPHYARAEAETVVQINGMGPFDVKYVNPKDDPRGQ